MPDFILILIICALIFAGHAVWWMATHALKHNPPEYIDEETSRWLNEGERHNG